MSPEDGYKIADCPVLSAVPRAVQMAAMSRPAWTRSRQSICWAMNVGPAIAASTAISASTTSSSIRVTPCSATCQRDRVIMAAQ